MKSDEKKLKLAENTIFMYFEIHFSPLQSMTRKFHQDLVFIDTPLRAKFDVLGSHDG